MKLLLDENLSPRLISGLPVLFAGSRHVHDVGLGGLDDGQVWDFAVAHGFAIVSKDSDFVQRSLLERKPPKIIWLRIGNCSTLEIERLIHAASPTIERFLSEDTETCLILGPV